MGIAVTLESFLKTRNITFDVVEHSYTEGSFNTARHACIPPTHLAKGVVFRDEDFHYIMAVIPASHRVLRHTLNQILDRHLVMADEDELDDLFFDCHHGAIPSIGQAYGLHVIWDEQLQNTEDLWVEAGDHEHLIHVHSQQFEQAMGNSLNDMISTQAKHALRRLRR